MRLLKPILFLFILLPCLGRTKASNSLESILKTTLEAHNTQLKKIKHLHGKMIVTPFDSGAKGYPTGEFWISENHLHLKSSSENTLTETEKNKETIKILTTTENSGLATTRQGAITDKNMVCVGNPWDYNLFTFIGPKNHRDTLDDLVNNPEVLSSARIEKGESGTMVVFDISHSKGKMTIWLSPEHNYLAKKVHGEFHVSKRNTIADFTITDFTEAEPGVFLPTECICTTQSGAEKKGWSAKFKYFQVNKPIAKADLTLNFPENIVVTDETKRQVLRTDQDGKPSLPVLSKNGKQIIYGDISPIPATKGNIENSASTEEASGMNWYYFVAVGLGLIAAAWILTVRSKEAIK